MLENDEDRGKEIVHSIPSPLAARQEEKNYCSAKKKKCASR